MRMRKLPYLGTCSDEVYIAAVEELVKEVNEAVDSLKSNLGNYVDVSSILSQLPKETIFYETPNEDYYYYYYYDEDFRKIEVVNAKQREIAEELRNMANLIKYIAVYMETTYPPQWYGDEYGYVSVHPTWLDEAASVTSLFFDRISESMDSYLMKLGLISPNYATYDDCIHQFQQLHLMEESPHQ
ncbi:hypothetical protein ABFX02_11G111800 [Erythranthe guttata]